jgi:hypothetical protein
MEIMEPECFMVSAALADAVSPSRITSMDADTTCRFIVILLLLLRRGPK